jgi:SAM-dependent methyltransferase
MHQLGHLIRQAVLLQGFRDSGSYWERRYRAGGTSGSGSSGHLAAFKAEVLNEFIRAEKITTVLEFGCGDGQQLALADYPRYLGLDVSKTSVRLCSERFRGDSSKAFMCYEPATTPGLGQFLTADLTLSLDVIYHLVEDAIYDRYLNDVFNAASRFVIIYSSNKDSLQRLPHVRHRSFTQDVADRRQDFDLIRELDNRYPDESESRFYIFARR